MDLKKLQNPLETQLARLGYELVLVEAAAQGRDKVLRLFVDHLGAAESGRPVTLDDCVAVNEGLLAWLDVEFPGLREEMGLEISSPGLDRPLVRPAHFERFRGRLCRIQTTRPLNGQKRFKGWILGADAESVQIEEDGALKTVPLAEIHKARLAPFEEEGAPKPKFAPAAAGRAIEGGAEKSPGKED
ncbi:MAG: ribosome maturation factor RimP [Acidobacteria bacterium]|nr:ribosome maturation factor RimP [Acidobacteriota bacterium]